MYRFTYVRRECRVPVPMIVETNTALLYDARFSLTLWHPESKATVGLKRNILEVKDDIDGHYKEKLTLEGLAGTFYIHKSYLARCFKEQLGMTVTTYINSVRVTKAKEMLRFSEETVETVAAECGIDDPNYFSRMFKKIEGVSPGDYRRMWHNDGNGDK